MAGETVEPNGGAMTRRQVITAAAAAGMLLQAGPSGAMEMAMEEEPMARTGREYDVVVVGGGPAGLSAALVLGRACRKVLVCDAGHGRNAPAAGVHGFLTQDGTPPAELRRVGREQLKPYGVEFHQGTVSDARRVEVEVQMEGRFEVTLEGAGAVTCRKLILATGLVDVLPEIPGLRELWGSGVIQCPFCHGWEFRDRPWSFQVPTAAVVETTTLLLGWTKRLTFLSNGPAGLSPGDRAWLAGHAVEVVEDRIERLEGGGGALRAIRFEGGRRLEPAVLFVRARLRQSSKLPERLGCALVAEGPKAGMVQTDPFGATSVEGLYVVGDASDAGVPSVASAVAEGSIAAAFASKAIFTEDASRPTKAGATRRG